jgi:hypothetical protein
MKSKGLSVYLKNITRYKRSIKKQRFLAEMKQLHSTTAAIIKIFQ